MEKILGSKFKPYLVKVSVAGAKLSEGFVVTITSYLC